MIEQLRARETTQQAEVLRLQVQLHGMTQASGATAEALAQSRASADARVQAAREEEQARARTALKQVQAAWAAEKTAWVQEHEHERLRAAKETAVASVVRAAAPATTTEEAANDLVSAERSVDAASAADGDGVISDSKEAASKTLRPAVSEAQEQGTSAVAEAFQEGQQNAGVLEVEDLEEDYYDAEREARRERWLAAQLPSTGSSPGKLIHSRPSSASSIGLGDAAGLDDSGVGSQRRRRRTRRRPASAGPARKLGGGWLAPQDRVGTAVVGPAATAPLHDPLQISSSDISSSKGSSIVQSRYSDNHGGGYSEMLAEWGLPLQGKVYRDPSKETLGSSESIGLNPLGAVMGQSIGRKVLVSGNNNGHGNTAVNSLSVRMRRRPGLAGLRPPRPGVPYGERMLQTGTEGVAALAKRLQRY